jgi:predicted DCC family thiol-disulfide oxidoreductase YuxK
MAGVCWLGRGVFSYGAKTDMTNKHSPQGIWFVYDGECPLCQQAALALRIKDAYGVLQLLNARENAEHSLIKKINVEGFDLDEGMVIHDGERFYHGKDALRFMAKYGDNKGLFNLMTKLLYWSDSLANVTYPWLRGIRNMLLRRKNSSRIDNLRLQDEPIFKRIFGADWDALPTVMRKHYANKPYTQDVTVVEGTLDVSCSGPFKYLAPVLWLLRGIPPANEKNVPVTVQFESDPHTQSFTFNRVFQFNHRKPYSFRSRMIQIKDNEVIEIMRFGLCWRMQCVWEDNRVKLNHKGYALHLAGHFIPMPLTLLLGAGNAEEMAIDDNNFEMRVEITHPWWGSIYQYKGLFTVKTAR